MKHENPQNLNKLDDTDLSGISGGSFTASHDTVQQDTLNQPSDGSTADRENPDIPLLIPASITTGKFGCTIGHTEGTVTFTF